MKAVKKASAGRPRAALIAAVAAAAALWFWMFSPWTAGRANFWLTMAAAGLALTTMAARFGNLRASLSLRRPPKEWLAQLLLGFGIAALLWGAFWVGDKVSGWLFGFARPQVDSIYGLKQGLPPLTIALLLLLVIGPAEELFWRGYVQQALMTRLGDNVGAAAAVAVYTLIHLWSFNFMLIMSALVCGVAWGGLYRLRPRWLPALVLSHALWDACVFVVFPI